MADEEDRPMTEWEWLAGDDPTRMLNYLCQFLCRQQRSDNPQAWSGPGNRRLRLVACGWIGLARDQGLTLRRRDVRHVSLDELEQAASPPVSGTDWTWVQDLERHTVPSHRTKAAILRDIFGNPFCPVTVDPALRTGTVVSLAEAIDTGRAFDRMPILGDALEDAGCTNAEILNHCRLPGVHVRGCWVVDLILGRE
jgi:hypothetical protein